MLVLMGLLRGGGDGVDADVRDHEGHELGGVEVGEGEGGGEVADEGVLLHFEVGGRWFLSGNYRFERAFLLHEGLESRGGRVGDADHHVAGWDVGEGAAGGGGEVEAEVGLEGALTYVVLQDVVAGGDAGLVGDRGHAGQPFRARCHDGGIHV